MSASMVDTARPEPSRLYRWAVLLFVSVAMGGNYYIYDSINPLERIFIDKLGFSATAFGWLNSAYSVAAVATLLIGGIIIDRIGTKKAITFFAVLCLLGAALTAARGPDDALEAALGLLEVGKDQLGFDDLDVGDGIHAALGVHDVGIAMRAHDVDDRVGLADVGQEAVAQALALVGAGDQAGDVVEVDRVVHDLG